MPELDFEYLADLVKRTQTGDNDAFAELYAATYKKQYRFAYQYVKDSYLAQDILQEVYIHALKNIKKLKNPKLFVSWLNQINFHLCFDSYQKQRRQSQELRSSDTTAEQLANNRGSSPSAEFQIEEQRSQEELLKKIHTLKPKEAQAIIMKYFNEMTIEEIAFAMNCSRSTVKRYLNHGRSQLEVLLGSEKGGSLNG